MIKVTMLIPVADNEGRPIDPHSLARPLRSIVELCGGYTRSDDVWSGTWKDGERVYFDRLSKLEVCCTPEDVPLLKQIAADIAAICKQECLYFDSHEVDVDFIRPSICLSSHEVLPCAK